MRTALIGLMLFLMASTSVEAGAWLREKGSGFFSVSGTIRSFSDRMGQENGLYLEYGLTPRLTAGIDINQGDSNSGHGAVFVRFPLGKVQGQNRFAVEFAVGAHYQGLTVAPMHKVTLAYGRSLETPLGPGWLAIDLAAEQRRGNPGTTAKLDATLGFSGEKKLQPMLQLETSRAPSGALNWAVTPSLRLARKNSVTWVFGVERKFAGKHSIGLKFAIWKRFASKKKGGDPE